jgi:hypothetical protein
LLRLNDMKHQGRGTKKTKGLNSTETVSEGSLLVVWNCTTVGQNHTISHDNNTTFSERATFYLESLPLSFKSPTTWLITNSSAWSIQSTTLQHAAWLCYARKSSMELTLSIVVALYRQSVPLYPHLSKPSGRTMMRLRWRQAAIQ